MAGSRPRRVLLIHWNADEATGRATRLRRAGYRADAFCDPAGPGLRRLRDRPPDALVIDLGRLPSHGRQVGVYLRQQPPLRRVPLVFVGGRPDKVQATRKLLPDAVYTDWDHIGPALRDALRHPPDRPVVPGTMDGYSGTPLPRKLGIREGIRVALVDAPDGFDRKLGRLPEGTKLRRGLRGRADLLLVFAKSRASLRRRLPAARRALAEGGSIWFFWPKKASGVATDLDQAAVRQAGLRADLVDYKICAVDETWSGLRFAVRRTAG